MSIGEYILVGFCLVAIPLTFIGVPIFVFTGGLAKFGQRSLKKKYEGLQVHDSYRPGDVKLAYHTYSGFLLWVRQDEHIAFAPPKDARILLSRLLSYNLTRGLLSYGVVFIPFLAIGNYFAQKKSIDKQEVDLDRRDVGQ